MKQFTYLQFLLIITIQVTTFSSCFGVDDPALLINTSSGDLRGRFQSVTGGARVRQFLGIPYAEPPVGTLRFARTKPVQPWDGVKDAVELGPKCSQMSMKVFIANVSIDVEEVPESEDCLSLNVYTPATATSSDNFPVMVWIHGGAFMFGAARTYNPSLMVVSHDVIVVTINYRLGVLGFFNIPGTDIKGNYAMHDQVESLKWIQKNIAAFGGNPEKVTIFGESAGGMSVSSHLVSPLSKGLFHRVIAQSGSALTPYCCRMATSSKAVEIFSDALKCDTADKDKLMECLRDKSVKELLEAQMNVTFPYLIEGQFLTTVTVDGEFLPEDPEVLMRDGKINKADVIVGLTGSEGSFMALFIQGEFNIDVFKASVKQTLTGFSMQSQIIQDAVAMEYLDHSDLNNTLKIRQAFIDMNSDVVFFAPAVLEAKLLAKTGNPLYMYMFDHSSHHPKYASWLGAHHGLDLSYVFGEAINGDGIVEGIKQFLPNHFSPLEEGLSKYIMTMWSNFAKYGDPNGVKPMVVHWPAYNHTMKAHLSIDMKPEIKYNFRERKAAFWNEFVLKLNRIKTDGDRIKTDEDKHEEKKKDEL